MIATKSSETSSTRRPLLLTLVITLFNIVNAPRPYKRAARLSSPSSSAVPPYRPGGSPWLAGGRARPWPAEMAAGPQAGAVFRRGPVKSGDHRDRTSCRGGTYNRRPVHYT
ncbi:hypothetical protein GCM10023191_010470 [Actinoallomurus oryzae]|uniref:Secreted protein n=1 Tax=Actinoallomurus oryzae TaxID=502180 RepID=A0ABP8PG34_9ACTN